MQRRMEGILANPLWLALLVALLVGVPVLALGEIAASDTRDRLRAAQSAAAAGATERAAAAISDKLTTLTVQLETVTQSSQSGVAPPLAVALQRRDLAEVRATLATIRSLLIARLLDSTLQVSQLVILDERGTIVAQDPFTGAVGSSLAGRPYVGIVSAGAPVVVSGVFRSVVAEVPDCGCSGDGANKVLLLGVSGRIGDRASSEPLGTLVALVRTPLVIQPLLPLLATNDEVYLLDASGRLIARATKLFSQDDAALQDLSAEPLIVAALAAKTVAQELNDPFGRGTRVAASAAIPSVGWHVIAVRRPEAATKDVETTFDQQRGVRGLLVGLLVAVSYFLARSARRTIRQRRELAETNSRLAEASRAKSEFLANMSHELRTPLNAVIGFSDVLLQRVAGTVNEKQAEYLGDIRASGRHLLALINDILDLAKVEAGRMELQLSEFSLPGALGDGVTMVRERAAEHRITISVDVDPSVGSVVADERKVKQVVANLLSNAVKFTPDGGRIAVHAARADGELRVAVEDTGVGIALADQARVFEEFAQSKHGREATEGTGLGLTLTKKIVELHGGRIWVVSEPGRGSTFTFALPLLPR